MKKQEEIARIKQTLKIVFLLLAAFAVMFMFLVIARADCQENWHCNACQHTAH